MRPVTKRRLTLLAVTAVAVSAGCSLRGVQVPGAVAQSDAGTVVTAAPIRPVSSGSGYTWKRVTIGGGGMVTGIDISPDGTSRLVRTDTYGAYRWNGSEWQQVVRASAMPPAQRVPNNGAGVLGIVAAPSAPSRVYMAYRGRVYASSNAGGDWQDTRFPGAPFDANGPTRAWGPRLAVAPDDPSTVVFGTPRSGLFSSRDGGATWVRADDVPAGDTTSNGRQPGITFVALERASGRWYAASAGRGLLSSPDGGRSWSPLPGGPATVVNGSLSSDGTLLVSGYGADNNKGEIWVLKGSTWSNVTPPDPFRGGSYDLEVTAVTVDRKAGNRMLVVEMDGSTWYSTSAGSRWTRLGVSDRPGDAPWQADLQGASDYLTTGDVEFDPVDPTRAWITYGAGVTVLEGLGDAARTATRTPVVRGIEQLVANSIVASKGSPLVVAVHDFGTFTVLDPDRFGVVKGPVKRFIGAWSAVASPFDPNYIAVDATNLINEGDMLAGYSEDGGRTWKVFPSRPRGEPSTGRDRYAARFTGCGTMAVSEPGNIVWQPTGNFKPWDNDRYGGCFHYVDGPEGLLPAVTVDGGRTWTTIRLPGVALTPDSLRGFDYEYYLSRRNVVADTVERGTFYYHHAFTGTFRSTDRGRTWNLVSSTPSGDPYIWNLDLQAVPGKAGHLFLTDGLQGGDREVGPDNLSGNPFYRSTNGGDSWTPVPGVDWVQKFGFGAPAPGASYPAVYLFGRVNGRMAFWRSTDEARTWTAIADFPADSLDNIAVIDADKDVFGRVYVGFSGSGFVYGEPTRPGSSASAGPVATTGAATTATTATTTNAVPTTANRRRTPPTTRKPSRPKSPVTTVRR